MDVHGGNCNNNNNNHNHKSIPAIGYNQNDAIPPAAFNPPSRINWDNIYYLIGTFTIA